MKSKQKQTPTEIIENQRQAVVEKIIEDMKRDGHQEIDDFPEYIAKVVFSIKKFMMEVNELW